ncbi:MAG: sigma-70 family RNA polymerase sigma factor [Ruminococcaceae bacterium]|nr:sigma-70 family RNA polymerase sigma factor [Oscillospiraceae bacterium]
MSNPQKSTVFPLIDLIKSGDHDAFMKLSGEYDKMIRSLIQGYDISDSEKDDLYQEGLIGLYKASVTYSKTSDASFSTYAYVCIKHSIISSLRLYYNKKNYPVRSSVSLNNDIVIPGLEPVTEPERLIIEKEDYHLLMAKIDTSLSSYERDVLKLFLQGKSYAEMSKRLNMTTKSVGNAIQRIRGKLKNLIEN